jgi:hypothetical protein
MACDNLSKHLGSLSLSGNDKTYSAPHRPLNIPLKIKGE